MQTITTIGLDIAKSVFQVHGVDAAGQVVVRRQLKRRYVSGVLSEVTAMPDWHRSLRVIALLVTRAPGTGSHCTTDAAGLCEALRQAAEE
jgi:transposase